MNSRCKHQTTFTQYVQAPTQWTQHSNLALHSLAAIYCCKLAAYCYPTCKGSPVVVYTCKVKGRNPAALRWVASCKVPPYSVHLSLSGHGPHSMPALVPSRLHVLPHDSYAAQASYEGGTVLCSARQHWWYPCYASELPNTRCANAFRLRCAHAQTGNGLTPRSWQPTAGDAHGP